MSTVLNRAVTFEGVSMTRAQKYDAAVEKVNAAYDNLESMKFNYAHESMRVNAAQLRSAEKEYRGARAIFRNEFSKASQ